MAHLQIIDANLARLSEGLRVIEDVCRFELSNASLSASCKSLRDLIKEVSTTFNRLDLVNSRSVATDTRAKSHVPKRDDLSDLITANIKRCTEACRSLEECSHDQHFTQIRYDLYSLEQRIWSTIARQPLEGPGIYVISDDIDHLITCAKKPYVPIIQYRNKIASKSTIYRDCKKLAQQITNNTLFIVNDFVDIAIDVQADGVHVGQDDIPTPAIRAILGETKLIGRTTHTIEQGFNACEEGADYISVGPIWETPSKPGRSPIGFNYLKQAGTLNRPFVAIGGINLNNIDEILPFNPPLIGAIRSTHTIENLWKKIKNN